MKTSSITSIMLGIPPSLNIMDESVSVSIANIVFQSQPVIGKEAKQRKSDGGVQGDMYNERQTLPYGQQCCLWHDRNINNTGQEMAP